MTAHDPTRRRVLGVGAGLVVSVVTGGCRGASSAGASGEPGSAQPASPGAAAPSPNPAGEARPVTPADAHPGRYVNLRGPDGYVYAPGAQGARPSDPLYAAFDLVVTDLATGGELAVSVPFPAHSASVSPDGRYVVLVEKWGAHTCTVDLSVGEVVAEWIHPTDHQFVGHAVFTADGERVLVSEGHFPDTPEGYARGILGVRDPRTLVQWRSIPSHGENPHELALVDDGRTVVVANQGTVNRIPETASNLAYVDVETGALIEQHHLARTDVLMAHLRVVDDSTVVVVTKSKDVSPRGNDVLVHRRGMALEPIAWGEDLADTFVDEILSVDVDRARRRLGATCPEAGRVLFVDIDARAVAGVLVLERPLGIALTADGRHWLINDIAAGRVVVVDAASLAVLDDEAARAALGGVPAAFVDTTFTAPHSLITTRGV